MTMPSFPIDPAADREPHEEGQDEDTPPTLAQTSGDDPIVDEFADDEDDEIEPQAQVPPL